MAIRRRPPHPARGLIIGSVLLLLVIALAIIISSTASEVPVKPIEVDVVRPS